MNQKLYDLAKRLHENMIKECSDFIVTGSLALNLFGLVEDNQVKDLDVILLYPREELINKLRFMEKTSPAKNRSEYLINLQKENLIRVCIDNVNVDFFIDNRIRDYVLHHGIPFNTVKEIVIAKKSMGRLKDFIQLSDIANRIVSNQELVEVVKKCNNV